MCGVIVDTVAASPYVGAIYPLHPPTINEISNPIHLSDPKAFAAMCRWHRCLLSCQWPPLPELFVTCPLSPSGSLAFVVES